MKGKVHIRGAMKSCFGCGICEKICPVGAIHMTEDCLGFSYPKVEEEKCIGCGKCLLGCPDEENVRNPLFNNPHYAIGGRIKDESSLKIAQSGGAFEALSKVVINDKGVVYGAVFDKDFRVIHKRATQLSEIKAMHGSKYVQSSIKEVLKDIKEDLIAGKTVLFSGTPCQISGLKLFIPSRLQSNLLLVDIVCHGVGAPRVWHEHVNKIKKAYGKSIKTANFRDKEIGGWHGFIEKIVLDDGGVVNSTDYTKIYMKQISFRYSCYQCPFSQIARVGDITIGDLWGVEHTDLAHKASDEKGMSLVLVNSKKGTEIWDKAKVYMDFKCLELDQVKQPRLQRPSEKNPLREKFELWFKTGGLDNAISKWGYYERWNLLKVRIMGLLPETMRKAILNYKHRNYGR